MSNDKEMPISLVNNELMQAEESSTVAIRNSALSKSSRIGTKKTSKIQPEFSAFTEERLKTAETLVLAIQNSLNAHYKANLSIAIKEGKARAKKCREEIANSQVIGKE